MRKIFASIAVIWFVVALLLSLLKNALTDLWRALRKLLKSK